MKKVAMIFLILSGLALTIVLISFAVNTMLNVLPNNPFANLAFSFSSPSNTDPILSVPTPPPHGMNQPENPPPPADDVVLDFPYDEPELTAAELPPPIAISSLASLGNSPHSGMELPIIGATGWAGTYMPLRTQPGEAASELIMTLSPGEGFRILGYQGSWWYVSLSSGITGWVENHACFINLPDVIPSMVFNITNAYASLKRSGPYDIPGITNERLYLAFAFNQRFNEGMFIVPALYATARRLNFVQQSALAAGETIVMYEAFRPYHTQQSVVRATTSLMGQNEYVRAALNTPPWSPTWFISHGTSHHQRGAAVDVNLARVVSYEIRFTGSFAYRYITNYVEHVMPTALHDLHPAAATFTGPGTGIIADSMTEGALTLQRLFVQAGFSPLASEWWHFNDIPGVNTATSHNINGRFFTESVYSAVPILEAAD